MTQQIKQHLLALADPARAVTSQRFFKTGPGEYGAGDTFIGVTVPQLRTLVKEFDVIDLSTVKDLLTDQIHECRLLALFFLVRLYKKRDESTKQQVVDFYLENREQVNNWDLVDSSAYQILGDHLIKRDRSILYKLAKQNHLWSQRIAIIATFAFIRINDFNDTLQLADHLSDHPHDLMQKAVGWMLREVGKRDECILKGYLQTHYKTMPRTMLRYAIEKFSKEERAFYLKGVI